MSKIEFRSTKTYAHNLGLSCAFRQWRAKSHCRFIHGYALQVGFVFSATNLDEFNWVVDFGGLKPLKAFLEETFDHKTLIAKDDPLLGEMRLMHKLGALDLVEVDAVGCEKFAEMIFNYAEGFLKIAFPHVRLESVEVREHAANSAIVRAIHE